MLRGRSRRGGISQDEMSEIESDLDELDRLLQGMRRRGRTKPLRVYHGGIRPKPAAFARAIVAGLRPLDAALQAGYRAPNRMTCWRLLRDPKVIAEIQRLKRG